LLAMLCFVIAGKAQTLTISGRVTDEQGAPIPFVSVLVKGKSGTTTDVEGRFSITAQRGDVLVISGVGYASKEVTVGTSTQLEITLAPAKENLSEVVVTAMGIKKQERALGYAVSKVDPQTMLQKSESNVLNTLAGKIPGVDIRAGQGAPGAASRIQIRGVTTFTGGTEPLIVVDGVPYSNPLINTTNPFSGGGTYGSGINNLDPNDIESISVLKGSAAASLYGSRASNGVVLITTKSGSPKKALSRST
jgi:Outer membrane cobalamin receptor protein